MSTVPTLDAIAADPKSAACLPREVIAALLARCLIVQSALTSGLLEAKSGEMPAAAAEPLVDAVEMARKLNVHQSWVRSEQRAGRIPFVQVGRYVRFRPSEVERALAKPRTV